MEALKISKAIHKSSFESGADPRGDFGAKYAVDNLRSSQCTAMILQHTRFGQARHALMITKEMREGGVKLSTHTLIAALKACTSLNDIESVKQVHAVMVKHGLQSDVHLGTMLVHVYAKCGSLVDARRVFEQMARRNVVSWNAMILAYAKMQEGSEALHLYRRMQQEGVVPDDRTIVAALKACSSLAAQEEGSKYGRDDLKQQCLEQVRNIHSDAVKGGLQSVVFVGNMLVDAYAKCGSLAEARSVFQKMPSRDVVSWNSMIFAYTQMEEGEKALQLYRQMQQQGSSPDERTLVAALKACSSLAELEEGNMMDGMFVKKQSLEQVRGIHSQAVKTGLESAVFVGNTLVDAYAKCGSLEDARCVFEKMPYRNVVSWTAIISGYALMEEGEVALQLYERMQQDGVVPNSRTFVGALKACSSLAALAGGTEPDGLSVKARCLTQVRTIHSTAMKDESEVGVFLGTMLVDAYAKCGSVMEARQVFEKMPHRTVVSWNSMILGHAEMDEAEEALQLYKRMQQEGVVMDDWTFVAALKALTSLASLGPAGIVVREGCLEGVRAIHSDVMKNGPELDIFVETMLVDAYAKCGSLMEARCVFEKMPRHNVVLWNALILGCALVEDGEAALQLYEQMQREGVVADDCTFIGALKACSSLGALEQGDKKHLKCRSLQQVQDIHAHLVKRGFNSIVSVGNVLVDVYAKCGSLTNARRVFEEMPHRDVVSWNAMILGYTQMNEGEEALQLYSRMQQECVVPDVLTFVGAFKACSVVAGLEKGKELHAQFYSSELDPTDPFVVNSLIDMYGKCGSIAEAQQVFDALPARDVVTWSALMAGYARQGASDHVFELFERMLQEDVQPNAITFLTLLTVCSHVGLVDKGQAYFEAMSTDFGVNPTIEHYTCMIDLIGRAGCLEEAMAMAKTMPFQADGAVWGTILANCQKYKNAELGRRAFECAIRLDKDDAAAYVMMSNIYAAAGLFEDAQEINAMRVNTEAWKKPGQSWWTDRGGTSHAFVAGDLDQPQRPDIHERLRDLLLRVEEDSEARKRPLPFFCGFPFVFEATVDLW